jgi:single-strand DNA-binding protein
MSVNKVILLGNIGQDPTIRTTQDGKKIATFSLATSEKWKDKSSGEQRDKTEWHRVVVFSEGLSSVVERFVKKGSKLYIEGALQTRKWTDNSGIEKYTTEVILQGFSSKLEIVDNRKDGDGSNYSSSSYDDSHETPSGIEDDIPF